jgi:hypothetical protein
MSGLHVFPGAILSLIATLFVFVMFAMSIDEAVAIGKGQDPATNAVRRAFRRFPRFSYALAVVIGMLLGHLFWT